jgi:hypothetical protein
VGGDGGEQGRRERPERSSRDNLAVRKRKTAKDLSLARRFEQFATIVRLWYQIKREGCRKKGDRSLAEIGRDEYGLTGEQAERIRIKTASKVYKGAMSNDPLVRKRRSIGRPLGSHVDKTMLKSR